MAENLSAPSGFTTSELVFDDNFSGTTLSASSWNNYITDYLAHGTPWFSYQGGSGAGGIYEDEFDMPSQVSVNNGLSLDAIRQPIYAPNEINGVYAFQTYPVTSGVVSTYGKMEFDGGYLQISMKEPGGDGSWPGLWLLPGQGASSASGYFEIDIQEAASSTAHSIRTTLSPIIFTRRPEHSATM